MGIKDWFFEITPDPEKENPKPVEKPSTAAQNTQPTVVNLQSTAIPAQDAAKFEAHFDELFTKANIPGPDYYEFVKMVQAMGNLTDEVKYVAAFSALMVQGLSKIKLLQTAQQYIEVIENDEKQFNTVLNNKVVGEINRKKSDLKTNGASIKTKEELIVQLQAEIITDKQNLEKLAVEIAADEKRFNEKTVIYKAACETRKAIIKADIEKINKIIT